MSTPRWTPVITRLRSTAHPATVARVAAASVITVVGAPLLALLLLLVFGSIVGTRLAETNTGSVAWAGSVALIIVVVSIMSLLFGIVVVATVVVRPRLGAALLTTLGALPRLFAATIIVLLAIVVAMVATPVFVVLALAVALALRLRRAPGVRRALFWAIPLVPLAFAVAVLPALLAAILEKPRTLRALLRGAIAVVVTRWRSLLVYIVVGGALSAALTWAATSASAAFDASAQSELGLLAVAAGLALLFGCLGTSLAVTLPPVTTAPPRPRRIRNLARARLAMLVVASLVITILPAMTSASSASASELITPVLTASLIADADGDGSTWVLQAQVAVAGGDPSGTVQFYDGEQELGEQALGGQTSEGAEQASVPATDQTSMEPIPLVVSADDATIASAQLSGVELDTGEHSITFVYTPSSALVSAGTSEAVVQTVVADPAEAADTTEPTADTAEDTAEATAEPTAEPTDAAATDSPTTDSPTTDAATTDPSTGESNVSEQAATPVTPVASSTPVASEDSEASGASKESEAPESAEAQTADSADPADAVSIPGTLGSAAVGNSSAARLVPVAFLRSQSLAAAAAVVLATTSATAVLNSYAAAYTTPLVLTVTVASSLDGARTLEVRDTTDNSLLLTETFQIVGGAATVTANLPNVLPGRRVLTATIVGDALSAEAVATVSALTVTSAVTSTTVTADQTTVEFGTPITFTSTTTTTNGPTQLPGQVTFSLPDGTRAYAVPDASGVASVTWTPTAYNAGSTRTSVSYFDTGFLYSSSAASVTVQVTLVPLPAPIVVWTPNPDAAFQYLTLTYPAAEGHPVPTGAVQLIASNGNTLRTASLVDGVVSFGLDDTSDLLAVDAVYNSSWQDAAAKTYASATYRLPAPVAQAYTPIVTVTAPAAVDNGVPFTVSVDVADVPAALVATIALTSTDPSGLVTTVGTVALDLYGHGEAPVTLNVEGAHKIGATVVFTALSALATVIAPTTSVTVAPLPIPKLVVSSTSALVAGGDVDVDVTAEWVSSGSTGLPAGTTAEVRDGTGAVLGYVTLLGAAGVGGYTGRLTLTAVPSGVLSLTAVATYGPLNATVTSDPLVLTVPAPATTLVVSAPSVAVGNDLLVTITAYPSGGFSGASRTQSATVVIAGTAHTVELSRFGATGAFSGTVTVPTTEAGAITISASILGDGIDTSAATRDTTTTVSKRATSIKFTVAPNARAGEPVTVTAQLVQQGSQTSPAPTGDLYVGGVLCAPDYTCVIPGSAVRAGVNTFSAQFDGDDNNARSVGSVVVTAAARTSALSVTFSPTIENWVYGEPITATWFTVTSAHAAAGLVGVTIAGASCSGPAAAGSCTVTPRTTAITAPITTDYSVSYLPSDDAPAAVVNGTTQLASLCIFPSISGSVDYSGAKRCGFEQRGVRTGSVIVVTPTLAVGDVIDYWSLNGTRLADTSVSLTLTVTGPTVLDYTTVYRPECYTLNLTPTRAAAATAGGVLTAITAPNCTDSNMPTAEEIVEWNAGAPRYAAGTVVYLRADASAATAATATAAASPAFVIAGAIDGATMVTDLVGTVTMDSDHTATATFAVASCVATDLLTDEGGAVDLTSAVRPASSATLEPATGACTTAAGRAGYVPGTTLTLTATTDADTVLESWLVNDKTAALTEAQRGINAVAVLPQATVATTQTVVVPETYRLELGARFSQVVCVSVTVVSRNLVTAYDPTDDNAPKGASAAGFNTATGCGGIAQKTTVKYSGSRYYRITSTTDSYVATGWVNVSTAESTLPSRFSGRAVPLGSSFVTWSTSSAAGVESAGHRAMESGPRINLAESDATVTINADWLSSGCAAADVQLPQGGSYLLVAAYDDEPFCENKTLIAPGQSMKLYPSVTAGGAAITPFTTNIATGAYQPSTSTIVGATAYRLEYCAPLGLQVRVRDDAGNFTTLSDTNAAKYVFDDGGCPPLWGRVNRTVNTTLTSDGEFAYSVIGNSNGLGPVRTISAAGAVSGPTQLDLQVVCFKISLNDATLQTTGNCPGGAGDRFTRGTLVKVQAVEADRFYGWSEVDAQDGQTAWVIMDRDIYIEANVHNLSTWEKAENVLSSFTQRALSAAMTAATGLMLAEAYIVKAAGTVMKVAAIALRAVGASGAVADAFDKGSQVVTAQFDAMNSLASCMSAWSSGENKVLDNAVVLTPGSTTVKEGASTAEIIAATKAALANQVAAETGFSGAIPVADGLGDTGELINEFFSNVDLYSQDAASSWSGFGESMGTCVGSKVSAYMNDTYK